MWEPRNYYGKVILAPMVRVGTLPFRLVALAHGADFTYGPEEIDRKIATWKRVVNPQLSTIDFVNPKSNYADYRIHSVVEAPSKRNLVFQMGTSDPEWAVKAVRVIENDVSAIDINCGCPKHFSVSGGMGAALLSTPDKLEKILTTLVETFPHLAITCKIRLLPHLPSTIPLIQRLQRTGIRAIAVHFRTKDERSTKPAHWEMIRDILRVAEIPVILNGDFFGWESVRDAREMVLPSLRRTESRAEDGLFESESPEDEDKIRTKRKQLSYLVARGAIEDPSVFRELRTYLDHLDAVDTVSSEAVAVPPQNVNLDPAPPFTSPPKVPILELARTYVRLAAYFDVPHTQVKYTLGQMIPTKLPQLDVDSQKENDGPHLKVKPADGGESVQRTGTGSDPLDESTNNAAPEVVPKTTETEKPPAADTPRADTLARSMFSAKKHRDLARTFADLDWFDKMFERRTALAGNLTMDSGWKSLSEEGSNEAGSHEARRLIQWVERQGM